MIKSVFAWLKKNVVLITVFVGVVIAVVALIVTGAVATFFAWLKEGPKNLELIKVFGRGAVAIVALVFTYRRTKAIEATNQINEKNNQAQQLQNSLEKGIEHLGSGIAIRCMVLLAFLR